MKNIILVALICLCIFSVTFIIYAQDSKDDRSKIGGSAQVEHPPWMEVKEVGGVKMLVPKDADVTLSDDGLFIFRETPYEYMARRYEEVEKRLAEIEKQQEQHKESIEELQRSSGKLNTRQGMISGSSSAMEERLRKLEDQQQQHKQSIDDLRQSAEELKAKQEAMVLDSSEDSAQQPEVEVSD